MKQLQQFEILQREGLQNLKGHQEERRTSRGKNNLLKKQGNQFLYPSTSAVCHPSSPQSEMVVALGADLYTETQAALPLFCIGMIITEKKQATHK